MPTSAKGIAARWSRTARAAALVLGVLSASAMMTMVLLAPSNPDEAQSAASPETGASAGRRFGEPSRAPADAGPAARRGEVASAEPERAAEPLGAAAGEEATPADAGPAARRGEVASAERAAEPERAAAGGDPSTSQKPYPYYPVRWIVGYPRDSARDRLARVLVDALSPRLGQPVLVENRVGAGGMIAAQTVAGAAPDGHTVFSADNGILVINPVISRVLYDPQKDFRPIGFTARSPLLLVVRQNSPFGSARALFDAAKAGRIDYVSPGVGSLPHLTMMRLSKETGVSFNHVPLRGTEQALNNLLDGRFDSMVLDFSSGIEALRSGRVKPLAISSATRHPDFPDVPTIQEALGLRGFDAYAWQGLVVPAGTPDPVAARLATELAATLRDRSVTDEMRGIGFEPFAGGSDEFKARIEAERAILVRLIRDFGATPD